jgi:hypothetical protein
MVCGPLPAIHSRISDIRQVALQALENNATDDASTLLALTADAATIEELVRRLESASGSATNATFIVCLQGCLGLPRFQIGLFCGNSNPPEIALLQKTET